MKNKIDLLTLGIIFALSLSISSCKKDKEEPDTDTSSALDNSFAEKTYNDVYEIADEAGDGSVSTYRTGDNYQILSNCAVVTIDLTSNPHRITIDFGSTNCYCKDFKYRRGKILVDFTGAYRDSASVHTISFDNYYVNDYKVMGTKRVTNNGHNAAGNLSFAVSVNGSIINTSGNTMTWNSTRTREWIEGESTILNWTDDAYSITGSAYGTSFNGTQFTANITNPLIVALNCRWIKQGKFEFTPSGKATRYFDYGPLGCDEDASVTINGVTYYIKL